MNPPIRDVASLQAWIESGARPRYYFFWGHQPAADGSITKSCLSQWWPSEFTVDGVTYTTAEHYMMAEKARLFGDEEIRERILNATHPKQAKMLGRAVRNWDEDTWLEAREDIVVAGNVAKFGQNPELGRFLTGTGARILVEASPVDRIWGIGLKGDHVDAERPEMWRGLNLLGFALMETRARLSE